MVTWIFIPDLRGEDLAEEDENFRAYLLGHGWSGTMGEHDLRAEADAGVSAALVDEMGRKKSV